MSVLPTFPQTRLRLMSEVIRRGISPTYSDSGTPVLNQKCIRHNGVMDVAHARNHDTASRTISAENYVQPGDALINSTGTGTLGRAAIAIQVDNPLTWDSHLTLVRPRKDHLDSRFLGYVLQMSENRFITLSQGSTNQIELSRDVVANLQLPAIDLPTQRRIADYLDHETAQIDAMAGALNGLVARLEERRRAAILDTFDSVHADSTHLGAFCDFTSGSGFPVQHQGSPDEKYPFLKVGSLSRTNSDGFIDDLSNTVSHRTAEHLGASIIPANSILLAKIGMAMLLGRFVRTATECCIDNNMLALAPRPTVADSRFTQYALKLAPIKLFANPGPVPSMNITSLRMHSIPLPPLDEQRRIADHLDAEMAKIDAMIAKAGELRALLDERRSALITATITGQHPVPEES